MGHARALLGLDDEAERERVAKVVVARGFVGARDGKAGAQGAGRARANRRPESRRSCPWSARCCEPQSVHVQLHQKASGAARIVVDVSNAEERDAIVEASRPQTSAGVGPQETVNQSVARGTSRETFASIFC